MVILYFQHGDELWEIHKSRKFLDQVSNCQIRSFTVVAVN